jgi:hypothetical protein
MSSNLRDLIDGEAELDDEEDDESFDEETGDAREPRKPRNGAMDDSSEEDEDDDDEEEARRVWRAQPSLVSSLTLLVADELLRKRSAKVSSSMKMKRTRRART